MLRPPHTHYDRLYVYYLDSLNLPAINDPDHIGTWVEDDNAVLFFHSAKDRLIQDICGVSGARIIYQADLDYEDWEAGTMITQFRTKTLALRPVWEKKRPTSYPLQEVVLDPSVIFGSGFHATTRLCLETFEQILLESGKRVESVLDLGTGTGLLAIAAAKYGVGHIDAIDNNPLACKVARQNAALNYCSPQVKVQQIDLKKDIPGTRGYSLVIANLYKELLVSLFENSSFWQAKMYLLSGFISGMEEDLLTSLPAKSIRFLRRYKRDNWCLWLLKNTTVVDE